MGRAVGLVCVALIAAAVVWWLFAPRPVPPPLSAPTTSANALPAPIPPPVTAAAPPAARTAPPTAPAATPSPTNPLDAPRTPDQRAYDELEARRAPFYRWLRQDLAQSLTDAQPARDDQTALVLYLTRDDPNLVTELLGQAVQPYAYEYGFRHVRFYVPTPPGTLERWRYDTEASVDENRTWHAFRK